MRTFFAYFFLILILWPSWRMGLVWVWFKANQTFIAKELCINRDRPELSCNGKCFLMTKMREVHRQGHDNFVNGLENLLGKDLVYVFQTFAIHLPKVFSKVQSKLHFYYQTPLSIFHTLALIKPPAVTLL
ncbi:MAG: hypothetical protein SFV55_30100 [Haliscomenobacter sp.]|uniref:hypothetical protein n=1 Tax=Haliscomenobacter sp. TaxID=2717303 RepID=UPI0029A5C7A9|nr:hypothetical protein [Haliscomenobacter sp.]MDX2072726.1 hypothetical protein [Haliscomenobacter sp.]